MRYLKAALAGLEGGLLLFAAVVAVEFVIVQRRLAEVTVCGDGVCDGYVQFGHVSYLGVVFLVGFSVAFLWFMRAHRRPIQ